MTEKLHISARVARFFGDDDGAVTVDWVVLTAVIVSLGLAAGFTVGSSVPEVANKINSVMTNMEVMPD